MYVFSRPWYLFVVVGMPAVRTPVPGARHVKSANSSISTLDTLRLSLSLLVKW